MPIRFSVSLHAFDRLLERDIGLDEMDMICLTCEGQTRPGKVTHTFQKGTTTVVVKDVPAEVCGQCGEACLSSEAGKVIEKLVNDAVSKGAALEILRYAA
jgi:YgiT-type zinc finger domain-containing protein